ncbi:MAG: hypothetical protein PHD61_01555 [Bacteroidales bacterium]|nr:hypothetical protein [Lentimicrobiaceae bacterium]MDD5693978.1 hypothetical protein [Bacteroidales bacterium]
MKRNKVIWILLAFIVIIAALVIIFNPFSQKVDNAEGTMGIICPTKPYHVGDRLESPCLLRPTEECSFVDASSCQFLFKNTTTYTIQRGSTVEVTRQRIEGTVQYVEVRIPK